MSHRSFGGQGNRGKISQFTRERESVCGKCRNNKMLMLIVGKGSSQICYTGNKEEKKLWGDGNTGNIRKQ